jgi:hypothetical protein
MQVSEIIANNKCAVGYPPKKTNENMRSPGSEVDFRAPIEWEGLDLKGGF